MSEAVIMNHMVVFCCLVNAFRLNGRGAKAVHLFQQLPNHLRDENVQGLSMSTTLRFSHKYGYCIPM